MGKSPTMAGLMSLPLVLGSLAASTFAGHRISATGRWKRYLVAGTVLMTAGLALLSTIGSHTPFTLMSVYMAVLGTGVGMLTQNLVLAAQNDVPADTLGSATSVLSFSRSMGGTVGTSVLGAVLAHRVATELASGRAAGGDTPEGGAGHGIPNVTTLPAPLRALVEDTYGIATAELFFWATPFALLALIAVLFIEKKQLKTTTSTERLAEESAKAAAGRALPTPADTPRADLAEAPTRGTGGIPRQGSDPSVPGAAAGRQRRDERGRNSGVPG